MSALSASQARMWDAVVRDAPVAGAAPLVRGGALTPEARVSIYAEQYWLRLRDVLRSEFEHVRAVLGDDDFDVLAARYVGAHPSTHYSLNWLGQHLEAFLRSRPVDGAPFLADLAALEFARSQAFIAADTPIAEAAELLRITPETAERARFTLARSVRVLRLAHDVRPLFRALAEGRAWSSVDVAMAPTCLVVFRQGFTVFHDGVSTEEAHALELAARGASLAELCGAFSERGAEAAFTAIASWVNEGLVATID